MTKNRSTVELKRHNSSIIFAEKVSKLTPENKELLIAYMEHLKNLSETELHEHEEDKFISTVEGWSLYRKLCDTRHPDYIAAKQAYEIKISQQPKTTIFDILNPDVALQSS